MSLEQTMTVTARDSYTGKTETKSVTMRDVLERPFLFMQSNVMAVLCQAALDFDRRLKTLEAEPRTVVNNNCVPGETL